MCMFCEAIREQSDYITVISGAPFMFKHGDSTVRNSPLWYCPLCGEKIYEPDSEYLKWMEDRAYLKNEKQKDEISRDDIEALFNVVAFCGDSHD